MKKLIILLILAYATNIMAQDSAKVKKEPKWAISLNYDNNYNSRYTKFPAYYQTEDTLSIACTMNSLNLRLERKVWKFIYVQVGVLYGRKGTIGFKDTHINVSAGQGHIYSVTYDYYYSSVPFKTVSFPLGIAVQKSLFKQNILLYLSGGIEYNKVFKEEQLLVSREKYFFGFKAQKEIDNNLTYNSSYTEHKYYPAKKQYYIEAGISVMIFCNLYIKARYSYISDLKNGDRYANNLKSNVWYEDRKYIHRYGGGVEFRF